MKDFLHTTLGKTGIQVHRFGLSATYWPGKKTLYRAIDEGLNYFFCFGIDRQMLAVLRDVSKTNREKLVIATGAYNLLVAHPNLRRTLEKRLRQLNTDYIDVFMFLGVTQPKHFPDSVREELYRFKEEGKIRAVGISTHDRKFAGKLAEQGALDVMMIRYNAAHRGAEKDIFPFLKKHDPGIISFTATRWRMLLRPPKGYPKDALVPTVGMAYRFVLSNPNVHICMTAPSNLKHFEANLAEVQKGPLAEEELEFMRKFGDMVYQQKKWFM